MIFTGLGLYITSHSRIFEPETVKVIILEL